MAGLLARNAERLDVVAGADDQLIGAGDLSELDGDRVAMVERRQYAALTGEGGWCRGLAFQDR